MSPPVPVPTMTWPPLPPPQPMTPPRANEMIPTQGPNACVTFLMCSSERTTKKK
jgi:hypothetical protein